MTQILNRRLVTEGSVIFREGDSGTSAYVVQSGRVRIVKGMESSTPVLLGHVEEGGLFGEMALIDNSPRMASAVAETSAVLIAIPEDTMRRKLGDADPVLRMIVTIMIRMIRYKSTDARLEQSALSELEAAAADTPERPGDGDAA